MYTASVQLDLQGKGLLHIEDTVQSNVRLLHRNENVLYYILFHTIPIIGHITGLAWFIGTH